MRLPAAIWLLGAYHARAQENIGKLVLDEQQLNFTGELFSALPRLEQLQQPGAGAAARRR